MIFRKNGFLNFAILKSSPNSETAPPDQKVRLSSLDIETTPVKLGAFLKTNLGSKFESDRNMFTTPNHGLNLLRWTNILDFLH